MLSLAYLGDAVYESLVREYLMENSSNTPAALHQITTTIVCAKGQSEALSLIVDILTNEELEIVRRGRNSSKAAVPRNTSPKFYRSATALEALFGYLDMTNSDERIKQLFQVICEGQIYALLKNDNSN